MDPFKAAKIRRVFNMLGQFSMDADGMAKKIAALEQCVDNNRYMASLKGTISEECLASAIDMVRSRTFFPIRPNSLTSEHPSSLVQELQSEATQTTAKEPYEHVYKHFEGLSFSLLKARGD